MSFQIRTTTFPDGEVHPVLVGDGGLPLWWPNLWLTTTHRSHGAAFGTLHSYATFLARLYSWAGKHRLPLELRLLSREWLLDWELHSLADEMSVKVRGVQPPKAAHKRPGKIEKFLGAKASAAPLVSNQTIAVRLNIVADYLKWIGTEGVNRAPFRDKEAHTKALYSMIEILRAKIPICHDHNRGRGHSYDRGRVLRLLEVTSPGHPENPFQSTEVQVRNHLIVHMLFTFGFRISELAALKCKDIDFQARVLAVARRPDDPEDPRGRYAPRQKTRARIMALELSDQIKTYRDKIRNHHDLALRHPYLLVSEQDGKAISKSALEKVFRVLRENVSGLPERLTPHYLRHAWNYEWSIVCKEKGISDDEADQLRKYLMGWKMNSTMAEQYNKPYIQEKADECSIAVQRRMWLVAKEAQDALERLRTERLKLQGKKGEPHG